MFQIAHRVKGWMRARTPDPIVGEIYSCYSAGSGVSASVRGVNSGGVVYDLVGPGIMLYEGLTRSIGDFKFIYKTKGEKR